MTASVWAGPSFNSPNLAAVADIRHVSTAYARLFIVVCVCCAPAVLDITNPSSSILGMEGFNSRICNAVCRRSSMGNVSP